MVRISILKISGVLLHMTINDEFLNSNNLQNRPIVITPPIYCKLKRYRLVNRTSNQQIVPREFDVVANAYGLQYGIFLFLSPLP